MSELDHLVVELRKRFSNLPSPSDAIWAQSPAAKVIDCVLSLNRHYDRVVLPRVQRFARNHPDIVELSQLRALITQYATPLEFCKAELNYNDERRAKTLLGVIDYLLDAELEHEGRAETDRLGQWATWARPGDYLAVDVPGFGLAGFQYLRMLFGAQTTKPDVHIIRFVSEAIGRKIADIKALYLLERAAKQADLPIRELDITIWETGARRGNRPQSSA